jgi:PII-like signaling protein
MLSKGPAKKVIIYVNEDSRHHGAPLYEAILAFLDHKGVSGSTATRALAGFGGRKQMHTAKIEVLAEHFPIRIEWIDSAERVNELLPTLYDMVSDGLIEVQETTIIKHANAAAKPETLARHRGLRGPAKLLRIFLGEADQLTGEPLYEALLKRLRMLDIAGATVHRGILGYGAKGHTHKRSFFHVSGDLPIMIAVIDTEAKIEQARQMAEELLQDGLIVISDVDVIRYVHDHSLEEAAHE